VTTDKPGPSGLEELASEFPFLELEVLGHIREHRAQGADLERLVVREGYAMHAGTSRGGQP
jgi:hypothetical protein